MNEELKYSITTFSSKGALEQCERALHVSKNAALSVGIRAVDGVVLASYKKTPSILVDKKRVRKIFKVCDTICGTYAGLSGDFRTALETAREIAVDYYKVYNVFPFVDTFTKEFSKVIQEKTQKNGLRPIGCVCLFAGYAPIRREATYDDEGKLHIRDLDRDVLQPLLFQIGPTGSIKSCFTSAVGKYYKECTSFLAKRCASETYVHDGVSFAALALREHTETPVQQDDIEICTVGPEGVKMYTREEIEEILQSI